MGSTPKKSWRSLTPGEQTKLARKAKAMAEAQGINPSKQFNNRVAELLDWYDSQNISAEDLEPGSSASPPPDEPQKPKPRQTAGSSRRPTKKDNERIYSHLITNGMDKATVDKMSPEQRKAAFDKMVEQAKDGMSGDAGGSEELASDVPEDPADRAPASDTDLDEPPDEPIKVTGGKGKGRGGRNQKPQGDKSKPKEPPKRVEPVIQDDGPDIGDGSDAPVQGKKGKPGMAKDWSEWWNSSGLGMPEYLASGETGGVLGKALSKQKTPWELRAAGAVGSRMLSPSTWAGIAGAYGLARGLGVPIYNAMTGAKKEAPPPETALPPPSQIPASSLYWQRFNTGGAPGMMPQAMPQRPPQASPPPAPPQTAPGEENTTGWWDSLMPDQAMDMMQFQADPMPQSVDIIRQLRGSV